ncbi:MAG TPA: DUF4390 domain-containing protein [Thermoanaerobaculia bacterium]|nr:DUF4390 domain-containing protein [Thermoanaerobaculia bacterium]
MTGSTSAPSRRSDHELSSCSERPTRSWTRPALVLSLFFFFATSARSEPRIKELSAREDRGAVTVTFRLADAFSASAIKNLQNGLPAGITYHIEFFLKRSNWFDAALSRSRIEVICSFNSVTREYLLNYRRDRRLVRSAVITDLAQLERALTVIEEKELFATGGARLSRLRVRVRADIGSGFFLSLLPTRISTSWRETRVRRAAVTVGSAVPGRR